MRTTTFAKWLIAALLCVATSAFAQWVHLPGAAHDVGVGANGTAWVIGTNPTGGGFGIYRWNAASLNWDAMPGGAVRVDVDPQGNAWVVNDAGGIYRWTGSGWQQMPGAAKDVGIGANGTVWVIGTNSTGGGFGIYRWNAGKNNWDNIPGGAVRIDVDPQGNAWVVNSSNNIYRYNGSSWTQMPGAAIDIGIGGDGSVFVAGTDQNLYRWSGSNWTKVDGVLTNVSVDGKGNPWAVNAGNQIYAQGLPAPPPTPVATPTPTTPATGTQTPASSALSGLTGVQKGPALSTTDAHAVMSWIGRRVASDRTQYCYKQSYGRGAGYPLNDCGSKEWDAALCYDRCQSGYGAAGPVCWQHCPSGYTDTGALCHISKSLTASCSWRCTARGLFGECWWSTCDCPSGYTNAGVFCALNTPGVPPGYSGLTGLDLVKKSYGRGVGTIPGCHAGQQKDGLLCYPNCNAGYSGVGPVCWSSCPSGKVDCAAGCASSAAVCASSTASMVISPILAVAAFLTGGASTEAATGIKATLMTVKEVGSTAYAIGNAGYQAGQATYTWVNDYVGSFAQVTTPAVNDAINRRFSPAAARWVKEQYAMVNLNMMIGDDAVKTALGTLNAVSGFDPTGVTGVVSAFAKPICDSDAPMPNVTPRY